MKLISTFALALTLTTATNVLAASTGTLLLQGVVAVVNNVTVNPVGTSNTTLNITGGENAKTVAAVIEQSNNVAGYKINVKSQNGSELRHLSDPLKKTSYQLSYDNASAVTLSTNYQMVKNVTSYTGLATDSSDVKVNVTAFANAPAGTYEDTVTFQIVAN